jgi:hypothetical protein
MFMSAVASTAVHAKGDLADFSLIQNECVQAGHISFGPDGQWPSCRVTKGRWFSTIGLLDFYQAQYCLGKDADHCEQRALLLFANRAYTPIARLMLERIDSGDTQYANPQVVQDKHGTILVLSAGTPGAPVTKSYYLWKSERWMPIDAQGWLRDLSKRLPKDTSVRKGVLPEAETMSATVPLYRAGDDDCCPGAGVAKVELGIAKDRFTVDKVTIEPKSQ